MSVHVSSWAWKQHVGDDGAKLVLLKLADSANDDGVAWPNRTTLRLECEDAHPDTIKRRLRKLRDLELLIPVPWFAASGRQTSSMFVLPHLGVPSAADLAVLLVRADRRGAPDGQVLDALAAADAVGAFLRGGARVHPLGVSGGAATPPAGGAPVHPEGVRDDPPSGGPVLDPSRDPEELDPGAVGAGSRPRDPIWDALVVLFGDVGAGKSNARAKRNAAVRDLKGFGATASSVERVAQVYRRQMPDVMLTDSALATHYPQFAHLAGLTPGADVARVTLCDECGLGGGLHIAGCSSAAAA